MQTANEIKTIVQGWTEDQLSNLHTALPAKILSYNPATNRGSVTLHHVGIPQTWLKC